MMSLGLPKVGELITPLYDSESKFGWLTTLNMSTVGLISTRSPILNGRDKRVSQT